jgi:hypothetical protein
VKAQTILQPDRNITNLIPGYKLVQSPEQSMDRLINKGLKLGQSTH